MGKLIIFSAPSGAGKTTLIKYLLGQNLKLAFSVSACSRGKRQHEIEGKDYYFISLTEFKNKIQKGEFVEWEEVYKNHFYGTLQSEIERIWATGYHVIFDVDVIGGLNIKKKYREKALLIFVKPPSIEELKNRLIKRSTETLDNLNERLAKAEIEIEHAHNFDKVILNKDLDEAKAEILEIVTQFLKT